MIVSVRGIAIGEGEPLVLIAGPCAVESRDVVFRAAEHLAELRSRLHLPLIFKSSYRKANRTSTAGFASIGDDAALGILAEVGRQFDFPILTDIHSPLEAAIAAEVADVLQIPAFLFRQTDLLAAAAETGRAVNIKKGQFAAADDMRFAAQKVAAAGNHRVLLTERGTMFGYHDLVVDYRGFEIMRATGYPLIFDATHAVQVPSSGGRSGGRREFVPALSRAAAAVGIDGLFLETHPNPAEALSDADSQLPLEAVEPIVETVLAIRAAVARDRAV